MIIMEISIKLIFVGFIKNAQFDILLDEAVFSPEILLIMHFVNVNLSFMSFIFYSMI